MLAAVDRSETGAILHEERSPVGRDPAMIIHLSDPSPACRLGHAHIGLSSLAQTNLRHSLATAALYLLLYPRESPCLLETTKTTTTKPLGSLCVAARLVLIIGALLIYEVRQKLRRLSLFVFVMALDMPQTHLAGLIILASKSACNLLRKWRLSALEELQSDGTPKEFILVHLSS